MRCLLGGGRLLEGGIYFSFSFPNTAFIAGLRLKEEIGYPGQNIARERQVPKEETVEHTKVGR